MELATGALIFAPIALLIAVLVFLMARRKKP